MVKVEIAMRSGHTLEFICKNAKCTRDGYGKLTEILLEDMTERKFLFISLEDIVAVTHISTVAHEQ